MTTSEDRRGVRGRAARSIALLAWILLLGSPAPAAWAQSELLEQAGIAQEDAESRIIGVLATYGWTEDDTIQERLKALRTEFSAIPADDARRTETQRVINREITVLEDYLELEVQWRTQKALAPSVTDAMLGEAERDRDAVLAMDRQALIDEQVRALRGIADLDELGARVQEVAVQPLEQAIAERASLSRDLGTYRAELADLPLRVERTEEALANAATEVSQWQQQIEPDIDPEDEVLFRRRIATSNMATAGLGAKSAYLGVREPFLVLLVKIREAQLSQADAILIQRRGVKDAVDAYLQTRLTAAQRDARDSVAEKRRELENAEFEFDRALKEQEVRAQEIEEEVAILRSAHQETTQRRTATTEALAIAKQAKIQHEARYAQPDPEPQLDDDVLSEIMQLQSAVDWPRFQKLAQGIESELEAASGAQRRTSAELVALGGEFEARIEAARLDFETVYFIQGSAAVAEAWTAERERWLEVESKLREQLTLKQRVLEETLGLLQRVAHEHELLRRTRLETIALLQRSNLFLRGESQISFRAVRRGFEDLSAIPAYSLGVVRQMVDYFAETGHSRAILACLGLLVLAGIGLASIERRVSRRLRAWTQADAEERHDRGGRSAIYVGRGCIRSISIFLLFYVPAKVLPNLPVGVDILLIRLGLTVATVLIARRITRELFKYDARRLMPITAYDANRLYYATTFLIYLSLAYWPGHLALAYLGYANQGALDFANMAYWVLVGLASLTVLVRRSVILDLLPDSRVGRVLRLVTIILHPFLVLLVPGLLILYALNYEILATLITSISVGLVLVSLVGFLLLHGALFLASRAFRIGVQDPEEEDDARRSRVASFALTRFLLRFGTILACFWVLLFVNGARLDDLRYFFSVVVPIEADGDPATSITYWDVLVALFIFIVTLQVARHLKATLQDLLLPRTTLDTGLQYTITTLVGYVVIALGVSLAVSRVFDLERLGYVVAALSIGIGFGLQEIISNFISGLILLFERPLKVGDLIEVGGTEGVVRRIQIRSTTVQTRDNVWILVPNKDFITQNVTNLIHDDAKQRIRVRVGVAYGTDTALVRKALLEVAKDNGKVLKRPVPEVWFEDFGDSSLVFDLLCWVADPIDRKRISSHVRFAIDAAFRRYDIRIPFPQRDLNLRSAEIQFPVQLNPAPPLEPADSGQGPEEETESGERAADLPEPKG